MSTIKYISDELIATVERKERQEAEFNKEHGIIPEEQPDYADKLAELKLKEEFLEAIEETVSADLACRRIGITRTVFNKWVRSDSNFCHGLNMAMGAVSGKVYESAYTRAIGRPKVDEDGEYLLDGGGKIIYEGASDALAKVILQKPTTASPTVQNNISVGRISLSSFHDGAADILVDGRGGVYDESGHCINKEPEKPAISHKKPDSDSLDDFGITVPADPKNYSGKGK